jgi:hypothetical protein
LGQVASLLLTGAAGDISIRKGAVWWLRCSATGRRDRAVRAVLLAMMTPDLL